VRLRRAMTGSNSLELRKAADVAHTRGRKTLQWVCDWVFCGNQCVVERYGEVVVCDVMFEVGIVARAHILGAGNQWGRHHFNVVNHHRHATMTPDSYSIKATSAL
jgi:hypothetical protein